jgi:drug/metabolite transporter (DMT)-like permease
MTLLTFFMVVLSAFLHAGWNFSAKKVSGNFSVIYIGSSIAGLSALMLFFFFPPKLSEIAVGYPYMLASGLITAAYFLVVSKIYEVGDISVVYPISRGSGVVFTVIAAALILGEKITLIAIASILLICSGTVILSFKGLVRGKAYLDLLLAGLVGMLLCAGSIVDKKAMTLVNPYMYICNMYLLSSVFITPFMIITRRAELMLALKNQLKYSVIIGMGSLCSYLIVLFALKMAPLSYIIAVREVSVVIGSILGFLFLNETFTYRKGLGISIIVSGLVLLKVFG